MTLPEMPRPLAVERIPAEGLERSISATPEELPALAQRLCIPAIGRLDCHFRLSRQEAGRILAEGALTALPRQVCVVTLDEFDNPFEQHFTVVFVPAGTEEEDPDPESIDEIPYEGGMIDLGEAAVEQLALDLDPYPRRPGAVLPEIEDMSETPFAILAKRLPRN